jgi:iron complex outermembrane receptor protein
MPIAGVINIILKESTGKTSVLITYRTILQRGRRKPFSGLEPGFALNKKGFLNFSADFRHTNPTYRGGEYKGRVYTSNKTADDSIIHAKAFNRNKVSNAGSSEHTVGGLLMNGGYPVGKKTELFWTASANSRKTTFLNGYILPQNQSRINQALFPDGFAARPYHNSRDLSGIAGAKGESRKGWHWEYSSAYGNNTDRYNVKNTNNASQYLRWVRSHPPRFIPVRLSTRNSPTTFMYQKNFLTGRTGVESWGLGLNGGWRISK